MKQKRTTFNRNRIIIRASVCLMVLSSVLLVGAKTSREAKTLTLRNATDSLMALAELATEGGGRYTEAQKSHTELVQSYVDHMNSRYVPILLRVLPFSRKNVVKRLAEIAEDLAKTVPSGDDNVAQDKARENIERVAESFAKFLTESELLTSEPITAFEPEVMSREIQDAIRNSLVEAHEKAEIYIKDPNIANADQACMTNRRAIVYLYLARFGYQEIIGEEELKKFRTDISRTVYQNRVLQQSAAIKGGKGTKGSDYSMLEKHSDSERRRLRILKAMQVNDICKRCSQLWQVIEKTRRMRPMVLEICSILDFAWRKTSLGCFFRINVYNISARLRKPVLERNHSLKETNWRTSECTCART